MERLITFCVLLFHFGLVAALPFPEGYKLAYQQQPFQYSSFVQSAPSLQQVQPQLQSVTYHAKPIYNVQYQAPAQQRSSYGTNYAYSTGQQHLLSTRQEQERIEQQIKEHQAYNDQLTKQIIQNTQHRQNIPAEQYSNSVPVQNSYQQVNTYPAAHEGPLYIPVEQQPPRANSQPHWASVENEFETVSTTAETNAGPQLLQEPRQQQQAINPYRQIYQHIANREPNQPVHFQNLWKQYADNALPPQREKKRYLVIHPDGRTEYVDKLEAVAKKHPNYVLVNSSGPAHSAPSNSNQESLVHFSEPSQPQLLPSQLAQPTPARATAITETEPNYRSENSPQNPYTPIAQPAVPVKPIPKPLPTTQLIPSEPVEALPVPITTTPSGTSGSPTANPTPYIPESDPAQLTLPLSEPSKPDIPAVTPKPKTTDDSPKPVPETPPTTTATPSTETPKPDSPAQTPKPEPAKESPKPNPTPETPTTTTVAPPSETPKSDSPDQTPKPEPAKESPKPNPDSDTPPTTTETPSAFGTPKPTPAETNPTKPDQPATTTPKPSTSTESPKPTSPSTGTAPEKPDDSKKAPNPKDDNEKPSSPLKPEETSKTDLGQLDLSIFKTTEPITVIETKSGIDSNIVQELLGGAPPSDVKIYFITVKSDNNEDDTP